MSETAAKRGYAPGYWSSWLLLQIPILGGGAIQLEQVTEHPSATAAFSVAWAFVTAFGVKVWKELETDAVKGAAALRRSSPAKAMEIGERVASWLQGAYARWAPGFRRYYLKELRYRFELVNDRGLGLINANRLSFTRVYVELGATPDVNLQRPNVNPIGRALQGRSSVWSFLRNMRPGFALVLIGPPGSGKTTLLQHVLLTFAENQQRSHRQKARLPVFIELRKLVQFVLEPETPPFDDLLDRYVRIELKELAHRLKRGWLHSQLAKGNILILLDGFDEVPDRASRGRVSAWLDSVLRDDRWRKNHFIVSSRPRGYREVPLERADVVEVQPFDADQVHAFLANWYLANEIVSSGNKDDAKVRRRAADQASDLRERLLRNLQLNPLTTNPLLLTMICMVHRYHGALPGSRSQLYAEICQVLLERWRQAKQGPATKGLRGDQKLTVLRPLAAHMMERGIKQVATEEAMNVVTQELAALGLGDMGDRAFLHNIQDDSGLLLERERGEWAFAHLTFQEYLAADHYSESRRIPVAEGELQSFVGEPWWRETLLLYSAKSDASAIVSAALEQGGAEALVFAIDCGLEARSLTPGVRSKLEECTEAALGSREHRRFDAAAEALLVKTARGGYVEIDSRRQISSWVTAAEYQLFLSRSQKLKLRPHHWSDCWFSGNPRAPITGIDPNAAKEYCAWLDVRFKEWCHRLPTCEEAGHGAPPGKELACWATEGDNQRLVDYCPVRLSLQNRTATNAADPESPEQTAQILASYGRLSSFIGKPTTRFHFMVGGRAREEFLWFKMLQLAVLVAIDDEPRHIASLVAIARDIKVSTSLARDASAIARSIDVVAHAASNALLPASVAAARFMILECVPAYLWGDADNPWDPRYFDQLSNILKEPALPWFLSKSALAKLVAAACGSDEFAARRLMRELVVDWCSQAPSDPSWSRRLYGPKLALDRDVMSEVLRWSRIMLARESGELPAWEALRVVREPVQ